MLKFLRDRIVNRPLKSDRVIVRLVAVFGSDRDAQLAQGLFDQDGAVVYRSGTEVEAIWLLEAAPEAARDAQARRIRQLWSDAGLEPVEAKMYGAPPLDPARAWRSLTVKERRFPTSSEGEVLGRAPLRLGDAHTQERHPIEAGLVWTAAPEWKYFPRWFAVVVTGLVVLWVSTSVGLSGTRGWVNVGVVLGALTAIGGSLAWGWSAHSLRAGVARFLGGACLAGVVYAFAKGQARLAPGPMSWGVFFILVVVAVLYFAVIFVIFRALGRHRGPARALGRVLAGVAATIGATGVALSIPRELILAGLGQGQTDLAITPVQALSVVAPWTMWAAVVGVVVMLLLAVWMATSQAFAGYMGWTLLPLVVSLAAVMLVPVGSELYDAGVKIRAGDITHASRVASCVQVPDRADLTAARWSRPVILVGSPAGPSLTIDPQDPRGSMVTRPLPVTIRSLPRAQCSIKKQAVPHPF